MALTVMSVFLWPVRFLCGVIDVLWAWLFPVPAAVPVVGINNGGGGGVNVGQPVVPVVPAVQLQPGPAVNVGIGHNGGAPVPVAVVPGGLQIPQGGAGVAGPAQPAQGGVYPHPAAVAGPANQGRRVDVADWIELDPATGFLRLADGAPREVKRLVEGHYPRGPFVQQMLHELSTPRLDRPPAEGKRANPIPAHEWYIVNRRISAPLHSEIDKY